MANTILFPCITCKKEVIDDAIECSICKQWCHRKCSKLSKKQL